MTWEGLAIIKIYFTCRRMEKYTKRVKWHDENKDRTAIIKKKLEVSFKNISKAITFLKKR